MPTITISFPAPDRTLTLNGREHWAPKARRAAAWREAAWVAGLGLAANPADRAQPPSTVKVIIPVTGIRRRDPHNWAPTVKPIVDGLVDAGFWPDDDESQVTVIDPGFRLTNPSALRNAEGLPVSVEVAPR